MLRILLDEHIAKAVALQAKGKRPSMDIQSIHDWEAGTFPGVPEAEILMEAEKRRLNLVTYDQRTLWKHASDLLKSEHEHGGVVFVDEQTIPTNDIGGLVRALVWLWETRGSEDWHNRLIYLSPGPAAPTLQGDRRSTEGRRRKRTDS
ncbi:MAG: hypothetical protein JNK85_29910 [Verrucomicrobiales bacterium]|nr:hypothetical protein [Verrucomicrobiales bacterium]